MHERKFQQPAIQAFLAVFLGTSCLWAQATISPATRTEARDLGYRGVAAYQDKDYAAAHERLRHAYEMLKAPSIGLWLARTMVAQGHLVEAAELYLEASELPLDSGDKTVQIKAQNDALSEREALLPRVPGLTISVIGVAPESVGLTIDGAEVAASALGTERPLNPGTHQITIRTPGNQDVTREVVLAEGQKESLSIDLTPAAKAAPPPPPPPPPPPVTQETRGPSVPAWASYVAWGVGGVGVIVGATTGIMAMSARDSSALNDGCDGNRCPPSARSDVDRYNNLRTASTVGFVVGGVGLATGAFLQWVLPGMLDKPQSGRAETNRYGYAITATPSGGAILVTGEM